MSCTYRIFLKFCHLFFPTKKMSYTLDANSLAHHFVQLYTYLNESKTTEDTERLFRLRNREFRQRHC